MSLIQSLVFMKTFSDTLSALFLLGRHPCLFCHITKEEMQIFPAERGLITSRSLETLMSDLKKFRADGTNIKNAKYYNNVIDDVLLAVPIDQVRRLIS